MKKRLRSLSNKQKRIQDEELDITSLLDILFIVLVFLLSGFSQSSLTANFNLIDKIKITSSLSKKSASSSIFVVINKNGTFYIDNNKIGKISDKDFRAKYNKTLNEISNRVKEDGREISSTSSENKKPPISIVADEDLQSQDLDKVLKASTMLGHTNIKFIVRPNE